MNQDFYIERQLIDTKDNIYSESELLEHNLIIILSEPGAGKTYLLDHLASQLNVKNISATMFTYAFNFIDKNSPLIIDAFDEFAKLAEDGIYKLLGKISENTNSQIILSSRASEWNQSYTHHCEQFLNREALIVRLKPFNEEEQQSLFEYYYPNEKFNDFKSEITRFDLDVLLANPLFLKLFAGSYKESNGQFSNKPAVFKQAIERLAKESNASSNTASSLSLERKIALTEEIFAKLLLSGAEGISITEPNSNQIYPHIISLIPNVPNIIQVLSTQLFKPSERLDCHKPVHKIVAEYCAASYLNRRLTDSIKTLPFSQCLAIIAPNSTIRDELRGVAGWLATLGNKQIQEKLIDLDPYAILSNGDPSQLLPSSKKYLLHNLKKRAKEDPYFRRSDQWRRFSISSFFTSDIIDEVKILLKSNEDEGHLKSLLLELLEGSNAISLLVEELINIVTDLKLGDKYIRNQAGYRLSELKEYNHKEYLDILVNESSNTSLSIVASVIMEIGVDKFDKEYILNYLRNCSKLYNSSKRRMMVIRERFFIRIFIQELSLKTTQWLLDSFSSELQCHCGKKDYECECREGLSKIIGRLLDRYFELAVPPFNPSQIWKWIKNLHFKTGKDKKESVAVKILQENDELRQSVIQLAFEGNTDREEISQIQWKFSGYYSHSGLFLKPQDYWFIADLAYKTDNVALWSCFLASHQIYNNQEKQPNLLRRHMREQALNKPDFLRVWIKNRNEVRNYRKKDSLYNKRKKRNKQYLKKQRRIKRRDLAYINQNRQIIEQGKHWGCLINFAQYVLFKPEGIEAKFGDRKLIDNALYYCIDHIEPNIPTIKELAELHCKCKSEISNIELILYASSLEILKREGNLSRLSRKSLLALRTRLDLYCAASNTQHTQLKNEVNRLLFQTPQQIEEFLREYLELQLSDPNCKSPQVYWLRGYEEFQEFRKNLSLEWLVKYPQMAFEVEKELFIQSVLYGDRKRLNKLIEERSLELLDRSTIVEEDEIFIQRCQFWFVRAIFFLENDYEKYWNYLSQDKNSIFLFSSSFEKIKEDFPTLSALKLEMLLNTFIDLWEKVKLPSSYGTESPAEERAYRILSNFFYEFEKNDPKDSIPVLDRLLADNRYKDFFSILKSMRFNLVRKQNLQEIVIPTPLQLVEIFDKNEVITVEGLRALVLDELELYQKDLIGSDTTSKDIFYEKDKRLNEVQSIQRVADRLRLRLENRGVTISLEHQMKDANRCDITCSKMINSQRKLLVIEAKGQWHKDLYISAYEQLYSKYSIHPNAEQQGIYLVLWFSKNEKVAGRSNKQGRGHKMKSAEELKRAIESQIPSELMGLIDVFVLDVSRE